jgi:hypothetical protein
MIANCPCCGFPPSVVQVPVNEYLPDGTVSASTVMKVFVTCTNPDCGLQMRAVRFPESTKMIAAWNKRHVEPAHVERPEEPPTPAPENLDYPPPVL